MAEKKATVYELSNVQLVDKFIEACAMAGISNSGLCIDPSAGADIVQMNYLKGAVLARMDGEEPPFEPRTVVRAKDGVSIRPKRYGAPVLCGDKTYLIERAWYDDIWYLTFVELGDFSELKAQYPAEQFCLVESTAEVASAPCRSNLL